MAGLTRRSLLVGGAGWCWPRWAEAEEEGEIMRLGGSAGTSFVARLRHAPFPYDGPFGDSGMPFFDARDQAGGRAHATGDGNVYGEALHYRDDRVLFHLPPGFTARKPFAMVVFFHGHGSEIVETIGRELDIAGQIDRCGRNLILVAPQLALKAADSSPGKLFARNGLRRLLDEAAALLAQRLGRAALPALRSAPVIVSAFSGGYRAAAFSADRGGLGARLRGLLLFDALYGDRELIEHWLLANRRNAFLISLFGESTLWHQAKLAEALWARGLRYRADLPARLAGGQRIFLRVDTGHGAIPIEGPPLDPLAVLLGRLPAATAATLSVR